MRRRRPAGFRRARRPLSAGDSQVSRVMPPSNHRQTLWFILALSVVPLGACQGEATWKRPSPGLKRMIEQPRVDAYEGEQAADGTWKGNMLKPPQGTIPYSPVPQ